MSFLSLPRTEEASHLLDPSQENGMSPGSVSSQDRLSERRWGLLGRCPLMDDLSVAIAGAAMSQRPLTVWAEP